MEIKTYPNGIFGATTYLVYDKKSKEAILIDCTCAIDEILCFIEQQKLNLKYVLVTHGHFDHVYCLSELKEKSPSSQIFLHKDDMPLLNQIPNQCVMTGVEEIKVPCIDALIKDETQNLKIGETEIKVIHTKGHSKGGVCYLIGNSLFSGDTLFRTSIGRCDLFGGDIKEMEASIKDKLFKLDDNIAVFPGHGDKTTIGFEKKFNPYFGSSY